MHWAEKVQTLFVLLCGLQESNGWGFGFGFEHGSEMETTTSYHSNNGKDLHKEANGSISSPSNANVNPEGSSWAFNQASLDTGNEKEVLYLYSRVNVSEC